MPARTRLWRTDRPVSLGAQLGVFRRGPGDPTSLWTEGGAFVRAAQTPDGPGALHLVCRAPGREVEATAWGPGADWLLDGVPDLLGAADDPTGFVAHHDVVRDAWRRFPGWRVPRSRLVLDALVPAVIEQKVTGQEAFAGYRRLVRRFGSPAPGPYGRVGLFVPPRPAEWAAIPSWAFLQASVDGARSRALVVAARAAGRLEEAVDLGPGEAVRRMRALPGVGVWTSAEVAQRALGDADAVSFGDFHVAKDIGWALVGAAVDDAGLAELLEPYAAHRYRVQALLGLAGHRRPRRGARMPLRGHLPVRGR
ncbi:MAG TPA: DNA-3-methyladenine glycosylase 2 family protein [Intrasporangium sp.]|uniref:DNA-3-methyladenine glycosylase family protein n=1 Tax=Intrasporangium sp. TaxID=1925024 RepID=UPI002D783374|nr:DNA-3-methyladenine glycosylase 2 family protein [Intrasporangium sp.]HET7399715.1 DNA-3-methyladenine glycosylase 2 family protein [Intrasporangium sp.]